jgi:hypothetical protein
MVSYNDKYFLNSKLDVSDTSTQSNLNENTESHLVFIFDKNQKLIKSLLFTSISENTIPFGDQAYDGTVFINFITENKQLSINFKNDKLESWKILSSNQLNSRTFFGEGCECINETMYCAADKIDNMGTLSKVAFIFDWPMCLALNIGDCLVEKCKDFDEQDLC